MTTEKMPERITEKTGEKGISPYNLKVHIEHLVAGFLGEADSRHTGGDLIERLLIWPPDLFAVTSIILKQTGAYVFVVLPLDTWPDAYWKKRLEVARRQWYKWILEPKSTLEKLNINVEDQLADVRDDQADTVRKKLQRSLHSFVHALSDELLEQVTIDDIRELVDLSPQFDDSANDLPDGKLTGDEETAWLAWRVCKGILDLHALADEICRGFGTPSGNQWIKSMDAGDVKAIHCVANMLLAYRGSLSRMPTHQGVVLPKMRTPAVGITIRSLTHHLTFHQTEVDVVWRTLPWIDIDEHTINILVVPWPYRFEATWLRPSIWTTNRTSKEQTRFFEYTGGDDKNRYDAKDLLAMLEEAEISVNRIHLIVFPEQALTEAERDEILEALATRQIHEDRRNRTRIPMVLSGIRAGGSADSSTNRGSRSGPGGTNKVVLSTFFAGKWYQMEQNKHHRWRLNETQILQYGLGGALAASREWWEAITIPRRKLSVLAPNSWFTLCPLICEDLARQEPISDLIRGIGPTMLIAVLLDGPQLRQRWAGRYASVLADDPGSSVLSVSPLGMTQRSPDSNGVAGSTQIALWKDSEKGWRDIELKGGMGGVVLTVEGRWKTELTADGRSDFGNASVFVMSGMLPIVLQPKGLGRPREHQQRVDTKNLADSIDLLEITLFSFFVDAVIDCDRSELDRIDTLRRWLQGEADESADFTRLQPVQQSFARQAHKLFAGPPVKDTATDTETEEDTFVSYVTKVTKEDEAIPNIDNLKPFLEWFCELLIGIKTDDRHPPADELAAFFRYFAYTEAILNEVSQGADFIDDTLLDRDPFAKLKAAGYKLPKSIPPDRVLRPEDKHIRVRIVIYSCLSILWAVHRRLAIYRRFGELSNKAVHLLNKIEELLKEPYDSVWQDAIKAAANLKG